MFQRAIKRLIPVLAIALLIPVSHKVAPSLELIAGRIVDLSYTFNADTIYWPTGKPFKLEKVPGTWTVTERGYWYASNDYGPTNEHGGTHVDAPIHCNAHGRTIEEIPLEEWIGPAIVIDVSQKCAKNPDYLLNIDDIKEWEREHGEIPKGAWVVMNSGWGKYWHDKVRYLGTDLTGAEAIPYLHFPGFSSQACRFLAEERNVKGIALDTPSLDHGQSRDFMAHRVWLEADKLILENTANVDKLPSKGATIYITPIKIENGTGAPARVFAFLPQDP